MMRFIAVGVSGRRVPLALLYIFVAVLLIGCGGGGTGSTLTQSTGGQVQPTGEASASIDWPQRTRDISAPQSALSAIITLHPASGPDISVTANRSGTEAYVQTVTVNSVPVGTYTASVAFYANTSGTGPVVATGGLPGVAISQNSTTGLGVVSLDGAVANVQVTPSTAAIVATVPTQLSFASETSGGTALALSAGSATWSVVSGSATITPSGVLTVSSGSTVQVAVSVDGIASQPETLTVIPDQGTTTVGISVQRKK